MHTAHTDVAPRTPARTAASVPLLETSVRTPRPVPPHRPEGTWVATPAAARTHTRRSGEACLRTPTAQRAAHRKKATSGTRPVPPQRRPPNFLLLHLPNPGHRPSRGPEGPQGTATCPSGSPRPPGCAASQRCPQGPPRAAAAREPLAKEPFGARRAVAGRRATAAVRRPRLLDVAPRAIVRARHLESPFSLV